jgi:type IV secretion system protein VirB11
MRGDRILERILQPINHHLTDPSVTDVVVNKPFEVWVRKGGVWTREVVPSLDFDTLDAASILIAQRTGREFDAATPYANSTLPDGQRWQGVRPPGTRDNQILWAIRRPPTKARTVEDEDFGEIFSRTNTGESRRAKAKQSISSHYRNRDYKGLLPAARQTGLSIAFCGGTGSGKTDLIRRMVQINRPNSRMVTIQTDDEFGDVGPPNVAPLLYDETQVSSDEAVRIALRLIPLEIVLQEIRGQEAFSMMRAMGSGHEGLTSFHADEGLEIDALVMMARQHPAGREMAEQRLIEMAQNSFDVLAYCEYADDGYKVTSVKLMAAEAELAA